MDFRDLLAEWIKNNVPFSSISFMCDHRLGPEQKNALKTEALLHSNTYWHGKNNDIYRSINMGHEVRLDYITGDVSRDIPFLGEGSVNSVDFLLRNDHRTALNHYTHRRGTIRYRFKEEVMVDVGLGLKIVPEILEENDVLYVTGLTPSDCFVIRDRQAVRIPKDSMPRVKFVYKCIGYIGNVLLLHHRGGR